MAKTVDLRSDTVTLPSPEMIEAIGRTELGDDVFGEDPTINRLEEMAADRFGKEAAILVASGTMGNLASVLAHCGRGDEVILGDQSHTFYYEAGGIAVLGGVHPRTIPNQPDGTMDLADIEHAIRPDDVHFPRTRLICLENTQNRCGGVALSVEYTNAVADLARRFGLALHLDGARIFNAAISLGVDVKALVENVDSVSFCLSKGLAAPVGSVVVGSAKFVHELRRVRKLLGGGMRQAGIIAAAGIVALESMVDRLTEDHANASKLAHGISEIEGLSVDLSRVQTNIVYFDITRETLSSGDLVAGLEARGVKMLTVSETCIRAVTHYGISSEDIDQTLAALAELTQA